MEVTEQKRIQEELTKYKALDRLAAVVRDLNDAVTVEDFQGRILASNPAAEGMHGWSKAQALKLSVTDIVPPGRHEEAFASVKQLLCGEVVNPDQNATADQGWTPPGCLDHVFMPAE